MFKKILVPIDGSEFSEKAISVACELARPNQSELYLAQAVGVIENTYILDPAVNVPSGKDSLLLPHRQRIGIPNPVATLATDYLEALQSRLVDLGYVVHTHVMEGRAAEAILDYAMTVQPDVIVMSTHGRSGIGRWLLGSVADRVMQHSNVPVMLVRPE